jgi:hypothetical protein
MSLPAYLAPTASTRSKYQPKRASAIKHESSNLVRRTSTSIKELVNAATRSHHAHPGAAPASIATSKVDPHHHQQQQQQQSKRQAISSSQPATTATTTTPVRSSSLDIGEC